MKKYYVVMRIHKSIEWTNPLTGETKDSGISDIDGYIPVFTSERKARKYLKDGKADIMVVKTT